MIRNLINAQVTDLIENTFLNVRKLKIATFKDVRQSKERIVSFSGDMNSLRSELREFLFENLYCNWRVLRMTDKAKRFVSSLFEIYLHNPQLLPPPFRNEAQNKGVKRTICDYLAGMTDKYALEEYNKFFNPYEKV
jgi:dGTPase